MSAMIVEVVAPEAVLGLASVFGKQAVAGAVEQAIARQRERDAQLAAGIQRLCGSVRNCRHDDGAERKFRRIDRLMRERAAGELGSRV